MKKLLYILLTINIITLIIAFFMLLGNSFIYAIIFSVLGLLELVPIFALISSIDRIESLEDEVSYLYYKLKKFEEENTEIPDSTSSPITTNPDSAIGTWKCVKCGTVNKANTNHCSNCKASYSPLINPTSNPYEKKKISRWVKYK
ncbi:MAG: hypothetical protein E7524_02595 [Ruminococcaceae bacterium]|nr:hypothetical protein [Oscillospiraceae bacterium]